MWSVDIRAEKYMRHILRGAIINVKVAVPLREADLPVPADQHVGVAALAERGGELVVDVLEHPGQHPVRPEPGAKTWPKHGADNVMMSGCADVHAIGIDRARAPRSGGCMVVNLMGCHKLFLIFLALVTSRIETLRKTVGRNQSRS